MFFGRDARKLENGRKDRRNKSTYVGTKKIESVFYELYDAHHVAFNQLSVDYKRRTTVLAC